MEYKRLADFAAERGVTVRSIQRHVQRHANELSGHVKRYGAPKGTYLDDFAQSYIAEHLLRDSVAVMDTALTEEIERLKLELEEAHRKIIQLQDERNQLTERALTAENTKALADAAVDRLQADLTAATVRAETAEAETAKLKSRGLWARITRKHES